MDPHEPRTEIDKRFSGEDATALPWATGVAKLETAELFWLTTVRPDGRPHVTPLPAIWLDGALHFCTGETEQKAKNLSRNSHCILTTGNSQWQEGLDIVFEGDAVRLTDEATLLQLAARYVAKYNWAYSVRDGAFLGAEGNVAIVYQVAPKKVFGFGKGEPFNQTRWRFSPPPRVG